MNNPYATPDAVLSQPAAGDATYDPKFFAIHGRIGRLRYLAYNFIAMFLLTFVVGILAAVMIPIIAGSRNGGAAGMAVMVIIYLPTLFASLVITKRRFNDLNHSGWWSLLMFVPLVNLIAWLYLVFGSGTDGPNNYGLPPAKNSALLWIAALLVPIAFVGILAAVALPAYQKYVMRAKAAAAMQEQMQQQMQQAQPEQQ